MKKYIRLTSIKIFTAIIFSLLFSLRIHAQPVGQWTWMKGDNSIVNVAASYGSKGIFSPSNNPQSLYLYTNWTDNNGNFWLFGGTDMDNTYGDLWKFNPVSNQWVWMSGPGSANRSGIYGTQGSSSNANYPGARSSGIATWTDKSGNLWLFGGNGYDYAGATGDMNDLWKFNVTTNEWTWVKGSKTIGAKGVYGTINVSGINNTPGARSQTAASWTDNNGDLWLFGGEGVDKNGKSGLLNDLWKFNIASGDWTWIKGGDTVNNFAVYGTKQVANNKNIPGARHVYAKWKDNTGNFWLFGGEGLDFEGNKGYLSDLWKFDVTTTNFTWMNGPDTVNDSAHYVTKCIPNATNNPSCTSDNQSCAKDAYGNFWLYAGLISGTKVMGSIWKYDVKINQWILEKEEPEDYNSPGYGTLGVSDPTNFPGRRFGSCAWMDQKGSLWTFGGFMFYAYGFMGGILIAVGNDTWRFVTTQLPVDTFVCQGSNVTLDAGVLGAKYKWSNSKTTRNINVNSTGTYNVEITTTYYCPYTDTFHVTIGQLPVVDLGKDTSICQGESLTLDAGVNGMNYSWSTGAKTKTISVNTAGKYLVTISQGICNGKDSIQVTITTTPVIEIGKDTTLCQGNSITLDAGNPGYNYHWSSGQNTKTISVNSAGKYLVTVSKGSCIGYDSIQIGTMNLPVVNLGNDTSLCKGQSVLADAGNPGCTYKWSSGENTQKLTISSSGKEIVSVTNSCGTATDTISVSILPVYKVIPDTMICQGYTAILKANGGTTYSWNTSETTEQINVSPTASSRYTVTIYDSNCSASEDLQVTIGAQPVADFSVDNTSVYENDEVKFSDLSSANTSKWEWDFGDGKTRLFLQNPTYTYRTTGKFTVMLIATSSDGCKDTVVKSEYITVEKRQAIFIPSSFTPNGDGQNDVLLVRGPLKTISMKVFNQWGLMVNETTDINKGWDGTWNNEKQPAGNYYYLVVATTLDGKEFEIKGTVVLLK